MQDVKDSLSYVSLDLDSDLRAARNVRPGNPIVREFVLPDRKSVMKGFAREVDWDARVKRRQQEDLGVEDEQQPQVLTMGNERFHIPEVLFNPSNIGLRQMGLSEAVATCIARCPAALRPQFYANVLLTGGNCAIPNLRERLYRDLRASAPIHCEVNVILPEEPMLHAWRGMKTSNVISPIVAQMRGDLHNFLVSSPCGLFLCACSFPILWSVVLCVCVTSHI
ncbi:unnamed protein product [Ectocarpus fasciculatus]